MMKRHSPPGAKLNSWVVVVNPAGPHHLWMWRRSVHARHTTSRGASSTRVKITSRSEGRSTDILFLPGGLHGLSAVGPALYRDQQRSHGGVAVARRRVDHGRG